MVHIMVIQKGYVQDGRKNQVLSRATNTPYISGATILIRISGNNQFVANSGNLATDGNGFFYIYTPSMVDQLTVMASGYRSVVIATPDIVIPYNPQVYTSSLLTSNAQYDFSTVRIIDDARLFVSGTLAGRTVTMLTGLNSGAIATIAGNTNDYMTMNRFAWTVSGVLNPSSGHLVGGYQISSVSSSVFSVTADGQAVCQVTDSGAVSGNIVLAAISGQPVISIGSVVCSNAGALVYAYHG